MQKTRKKKAKVNKSFLLRLAVFGFIIYAIAGFVSLQMTIFDKNQQLELLKTEIANKKQQNINYERIISQSDNDEYIKRLAREKLGFSYSDERVFVDVIGD